MKKSDLLESASRVRMLTCALLKAFPIDANDVDLVMIVGDGFEKDNEEALSNWVVRVLSSSVRAPEPSSLVWLGARLVDHVEDKLMEINGGIETA